MTLDGAVVVATIAQLLVTSAILLWVTVRRAPRRRRVWLHEVSGGVEVSPVGNDMFAAHLGECRVYFKEAPGSLMLHGVSGTGESIDVSVDGRPLAVGAGPVPVGSVVGVGEDARLLVWGRPTRPGLRLRAAGRSTCGESHNVNQDAFHVGSRLVVVADGVGGLHRGEVAAEVAVREVQRRLHGSEVDPLVPAVQAAHRAVLEAAGDVGPGAMATTVTAATLVKRGRHWRLLGAHVGDSVALLWRDGRLRMMTTPHTVASGSSVLTQALGGQHGLKVDSWSVLARPGDRLVLASDGLTELMNGHEVAACLTRHHTADAAADALLARAIAEGPQDDVTVIVADVLPGGKS